MLRDEGDDDFFDIVVLDVRLRPGLSSRFVPIQRKEKPAEQSTDNNQQKCETNAHDYIQRRESLRDVRVNFSSIMIGRCKVICNATTISS
jgi:hypothetical protein